MEFARSAQAAKARTSERTRVLSQSRRRVVIYGDTVSMQVLVSFICDDAYLGHFGGIGLSIGI